VGEAGDDLAEKTCGEDAGVVNVGAVALVVAAVDAATGQVDEGICAFKSLSPRALREPIPVDCLPGSGIGAASEDSDVVAGGLEVAGERLADLAAASGDNDAERALSGIV
jgi:hypothetical protein